ncbi:MAG: hypothetical protein Q9214_001739 [Letrouitia sp. 1 TL-2023]
MAAGIGEASAILTVAQLGITLSNTLITYIGEVKDAPERIQRIGNEIATTSERLKDIGELIEKNQTFYIFSDEGIRSALRCSTECEKIIVDLQAVIAKGGWRQTSSALEKDEIDISLFSSLRWPFLKTKLEVPRAELQRIKIDLSLLFSSAMALKAINPAEQSRHENYIPALTRTREWADRRSKEAQKRAEHRGRSRGESSKLPKRLASSDFNLTEDNPQLLEEFVAFQEKRYREDEERIATERAAILKAKIEQEKKQEEQVRIELEKKAIEKYKREQQEAQERTARKKEEFKRELSNLGFQSEQITSIVEDTHLDFSNFSNDLDAQPDRGSTPTTQSKDKDTKDVPDNKSLDSAPLQRSRKRLKFPWFGFKGSLTEKQNPPGEILPLFSNDFVFEIWTIDRYLGQTLLLLEPSPQWVAASLSSRKVQDVWRCYAKLHPHLRFVIGRLMAEKGEQSAYFWSLIDIQTLPKSFYNGKSVDDFDKGGDFFNSRMPRKTGPTRSPHLNSGVTDPAIRPDVRNTLGLSPQDNARKSVDEKPFPLLETFSRALERKKKELIKKKRRLEPSNPGRRHDVDDFLRFLEDQLDFTRDIADLKAGMPTTRKSRDSSNVNEEDIATYRRPDTNWNFTIEDNASSERDYRSSRGVPSAAAKRVVVPSAEIPARDNTRPSYSGRQGWQGTETGVDNQRPETDRIYKPRSYERLRPKSLQIQANPTKTRHESNRGRIDDHESKSIAQQRQLEWSGWPGRRQGMRDNSLQHPQVSFGENDIYGKGSSSEADYSKAVVLRQQSYDNTTPNQGNPINPTGWSGRYENVSRFQGGSHSSSSSSMDHHSARRLGSVSQHYRQREHKGEASNNNRFTKRRRDRKDQDKRERSTERDENEVDSKHEISDTEIIKRTLKKFTTFNANELPSRQAQKYYPIVVPSTVFGNTTQSQGNTRAGQQERNASSEPGEAERTNSDEGKIPSEPNTQGGSDTRQTGGLSDHDVSQPLFEAGDASTLARGQRLLQFVPQENGEDWHLSGAEVASPISVSVGSFDSTSLQDGSKVQESPKRRSTADDLD